MCLGRWVSIEAFKLHETNVLAPSRICACTRKAAQRRTETARRLICAPWLRPPRSGLPPAKAPETCSRRYPRDRSTPTSTPRSMFSTTPPRSTRTSSRYSQTFIRFRRVGGWLPKLWRARSRLYRTRILQPHVHFSAFSSSARICTAPISKFEASRMIEFFNLIRKIKLK